MPYKNPEKEKEYQRKYRETHRERERERHREYYETGKEYSQKNSVLSRLNNKERDFPLKTDILMHYSNPPSTPVCNNCGEQDVDVLCIDHIEGAGNTHRRKLGISAGTSFYYWLRRENYPLGFQVLCANCNMKKARLERGGIRV